MGLFFKFFKVEGDGGMGPFPPLGGPVDHYWTRPSTSGTYLSMGIGASF